MHFAQAAPPTDRLANLADAGHAPALILGRVGPLTPPTISPWSTLIVVGVGLVAYYWAAVIRFALTS